LIAVPVTRHSELRYQLTFCGPRVLANVEANGMTGKRFVIPQHVDEQITRGMKSSIS
jgi:hypothetical protein